MSAIREVKYLRELKHQNVIEVGAFHPANDSWVLLIKLEFFSFWMCFLLRQT
jgi:hypothetical protein